MKTKTIVILIGVLALGWLFLFQGTPSVSSSPLTRITVTPSQPPTQPATLPPPPTITNPPLIPVTGSDKGAGAEVLIIGGATLLVLGVIGLALPEKRKSI